MQKENKLKPDAEVEEITWNVLETQASKRHKYLAVHLKEFQVKRSIITNDNRPFSPKKLTVAGASFWLMCFDSAATTTDPAKVQQQPLRKLLTMTHALTLLRKFYGPRPISVSAI